MEIIQYCFSRIRWTNVVTSMFFVFILVSMNKAFAVIQDYSVSVTLSSSDNDFLGVMFRYKDPENYYRFYMHSQNSWLILDKTIDGVTTVLEEKSFSYVSNKEYFVEINVLENQLAIKLDGSPIMALTDTSLSEGGVALYSSGNVGSYFHDVSIVNLIDQTSLMNDSFVDVNIMEDITILDEGDTSGPSSWGVSNGRLHQTSNIYQLGDAPRYRGTYAILDRTLNSPGHSTITSKITHTYSVSSPFLGEQLSPSVSVNGGGRAVIAWEDSGQDNSNVMYSIVDHSAQSLLQDVRINTTASGSHKRPHLLLTADDVVTAVWQEDTDDNGYYDIGIRRFNGAGDEITSEAVVNVSVSGQQTNPHLAANTLGQFVVVWEDDSRGNSNVMLRVFDADGTALTGEVLINSVTQGAHHYPQVVFIDDVTFLVTWQDDEDGNNYYQISARGFNVSGVETVPSFTVNLTAAGQQYKPSITALENGRFVIAYEDDLDGNGVFDIRMRGFNADSSEFFPDSQLNFISPVAQNDVVLTSLSDGGFVALWTQDVNGQAKKVVRLFDSQGRALVNEFPWAPSASESQPPAAAIIEISPGSIVGVWVENGATSPSSELMALQREIQPDTDGDGWPDSEDVFPDNWREWLDTDGDSLGNNQDDDDDNDGLPDNWEITYGLDPLKDDASEDLDLDGVSNLDEYTSGTDPSSNLSCNGSDCLPAIILFTSSTSNVELGQSVTIQWETIHAESVTISELGSSFTANGSTVVTPSTTVTYTLSAVSSIGVSTLSVTIDVFEMVSESKFNAMGQRVIHANDEASTIFVYGPSGEVLAELNQDGESVRDYIYLQEELLATVSDANTATAEVLYAHNDHLGTPQMLTDKDQRTVWEVQSQTPFGVVEVNEDPDDDGKAVVFNVRFPGQYWDEETQTSYNYFRNYDPSLGRYLQSDPIGLGGGMNTYAYVGGNPINYIDPYGLACSSANGLTLCSFPGGGPKVSFPTPSGWPASISSNDSNYHQYDVQRPIGCAAPEDVFQQMVNNPTPGNPSPATTEGTTNNAQVMGVDNVVTSIITVDLNNGNQVVVNITDANSLFTPGYVARTVVAGVAHTYGEGLHWSQSPALTGQWLQDIANDIVWGNQMEDFISNCTCEL